jgi:16S rRNA (adenine1518-N6/adenine1519-N6)-dimethyltransferase
LIKSKKSLGQNFLIDKNILEKIVNVIQIKEKNILEIGPGTGALTSYILKKNPKKVIVVEKDRNLAEKLERNFKEDVKVINKDILEIDENSL